jgi:hypothetical protein
LAFRLYTTNHNILYKLKRNNKNMTKSEESTKAKKPKLEGIVICGRTPKRTSTKIYVDLELNDQDEIEAQANSPVPFIYHGKPAEKFDAIVGWSNESYHADNLTRVPVGSPTVNEPYQKFIAQLSLENNNIPIIWDDFVIGSLYIQRQDQRHINQHAM